MSVLHLITQRPHLLLEHMDAYLDLVAQEMTYASRAWIHRAVFGLTALLLLCGGLILAGVGLMLWAVMSPQQIHTPWLLWVTPLVPIALSMLCVQTVKRHLENRVFSDLRLQIKGDLALLRETAAQR